MKAGDLVRYGGTGLIYLVTWASKKHFKLMEFGEELFNIGTAGCKVVK